MSGINKYPSPLKVLCAKCAKETSLYTHHNAMAFCCSHCGAYNIYDKQSKIKSSFVFIKAKDITFKVGTIFTIKNVQYVLINFIVKEEQSYKTTWVEYTLYNPEKGYLTLNESDGHYSLLKLSKQYRLQVERLRPVEFEEIGTLQLYTKYKFKVKRAEGEFPYNIFTDKSPLCADFVKAPYIVSYEKTPDEVYWFEGEYCTQSEVQSWVKENISFPSKEGIAPNQPFVLNFSQTSLIRLSVIAVMFLILVHLIFANALNTGASVSNQTFYQTDSLSHRTFVSLPFEITNDNCAVDVEISGNLSNSWLETDFSLVNETTGDQYYFSGVLEYYSGVEDGYSWSEGTNRQTLTVSNVKKGRYHYNVDVSNEITKPIGSLGVYVKENVVLNLNFLIALLCLVAFPAYIYYRKNRFDRNQWFDSDYSPYNTEN